jgi:hypothetical protein
MDIPKPEEWVLGDTRGVKTIEFRYRTNVHTAPGVAAEPLAPGAYRLRVLVKDVDGTVFVYPPPYTNGDGATEDSLKITVSAPRELPKVELKSDVSNYKSDAFTLEAVASHSSGIGSAELWVKDSSGGGAWTEIQWEDSRDGTGLEGDGRTIVTRTLKSFSVIPGGPYPKVIGDTAPPGTEPDFIFGDSGTYDFEIRAVSLQGSRFTYPFTVFIDKERPAFKITSTIDDFASPSRFPDLNYSNDLLKSRPDINGAYNWNADLANKLEDRFLVNGKITLKFSAFDNNGFGILASKGRSR